MLVDYFGKLIRAWRHGRGNGNGLASLEGATLAGRIGPEDLGRLFDEHAGALVLFARQWSDAPEDIVQDAFVALARQARAPDRPVAWLYRVVRNGGIVAARRQRRRQKRESLAGANERAETFGPSAEGFSSTDDRIDAARAAELLCELDIETRAIIIARIWGGLTFGEIARLEGCSLTTAHRRYRAGLVQLRSRLDPLWTSTKTIANSNSSET